MTPLERAAKAIETSLADRLHDMTHNEGPGLYDSDYVDAARAVLTAIREPSEEMVRVGDAWRAHCSDTDSLFEEMIDVAIHGPK